MSPGPPFLFRHVVFCSFRFIVLDFGRVLFRGTRCYLNGQGTVSARTRGVKMFGTSALRQNCDRHCTEFFFALSPVRPIAAIDVLAGRRQLFLFSDLDSTGHPSASGGPLTPKKHLPLYLGLLCLCQSRHRRKRSNRLPQ